MIYRNTVLISVILLCKNPNIILIYHILCKNPNCILIYRILCKNPNRILIYRISFSKLSSNTSKLNSVISSKSKTSLYWYRLIGMKRHGSKWFTNVWLNKCMNLILQFVKILNTYNYCKLSFVGKIFRSVRNRVP